jgi:hypothetical protein
VALLKNRGTGALSIARYQRTTSYCP